MAVLVLVAGVLATPLAIATPAAAASTCDNVLPTLSYSAPVPFALPISGYEIDLYRYTDDAGHRCGSQAKAWMALGAGNPHWGAINVYLSGCYAGPSLKTVPAGQLVEYPTPFCSSATTHTATIFAYYGSDRLQDLSVTG
jgi:hypothetical protein